MQDKDENSALGFSFVESIEYPNDYIRYSRSPSGLVKERISRPKSRYEYRVISGDLQDVFLREKFQVIVRGSNEILGEVTRINFAGGWVERFVAALIASRGNGGTCALGYPEEIRDRFIVSTFTPRK